MTISVAHRIVSSQQHLYVPATEPPHGPVVTHNERWADISNYTGPLTEQGCADLKAAGFVGIISQAITGLDGNTYTRQQLAMAQQCDLRLAGYMWCFPGASELGVRYRLEMFDGFVLEFLALDLEQQGTHVIDVERDLALCDPYWRGKTWVYSGKWFFDQQGWSHLDLWADRPLWDSDYDGEPDVDVGFVPYGGWTQRAMKQYRGTSTIGVVDQIDLNVRRGE